MEFEFGFFVSRIFGPGSLGLVCKYGWFALRASGAAESNAVVRL
jgi:hypothetical protein